MAEGADLTALFHHRLVHRLGYRQRGHRNVGGRQSLRDRDRVRLEPKRRAAEHGSKPAEAADHLVRDHVHVVCPADLHHLLKVGFRRHDHAAGPHHWLGDKGGNRLRILAANELFEFVGQPPRELLFGLPRMREAVVVRTARVQNPRDRQVEIQLVVGQPGERSRRHRDAVIALEAADDLLLARPAERVVHVPDELDLAVVCLRTRGAEKYLRGRYRRDLLDPFGEFDRGIVALGAKEMAKGQLAHLRRRRLDQLFVAVTECSAPESRHALDVGLTFAVVDEHPLPTLDDQRTGFAHRREVGVGVNQGFEVADGEIAKRRHGFALG